MKETKLTQLLRSLTTKQRTKLMDMLGWSERTWYRYQGTPGSITMVDMDRIKDYLDRLHGQDYDMRELVRTMVVRRDPLVVAAGIRKAKQQRARA